MYIKQLRIKNLACFDDVTLDFTNDNGEPAKWVVLLGENGTGKTTALRTLIAGIPAEIRGIHGPPYPDFTKRFRILDECNIEIYAESYKGDKYHKSSPWYWDGKLIKKPNTMQSSGFIMNKNIDLDDYPFAIESGWFIAAYRSRPNDQAYNNENKRISLAQPGNREDRILSLFDNYSTILPVSAWLADLDYRRLKVKETDENNEQAEISYNLAVKAIESIFPKKDMKIIGVTPTKDVLVEEDGIQFSIDTLSDGYQSAMSWIGDLVRRLVEAFPDMDNPLEAHGVVLVDEIDLHLHPSWQRTIVNQIRTIFPNLQFIVTTHSPFIAQDMTEKDKLIVLKREGDHVTVNYKNESVQGWRVDQILTSYLFGLNETRGTEIEKAQKSRRDLLNKEAQIGLTEDEQKTLEKVNALIAQMKSPPDEKINVNDTTDADLRRAANELLKILAERQKRSAKKK